MTMQSDFGIYDTDDTDPVNITETLCTYHEWDFDRVSDEQIAMAIERQWRTYSITIAWSAYDQTLRLICTFELEPPAERMGEFFNLLNIINDKCWAGAFTYWDKHKLAVYRYGLVLAGNTTVNPEQIDTMIDIAVSSCERYYPAIQLLLWGNYSPHEAIQAAIAEAYGHA